MVQAQTQNIYSEVYAVLQMLGQDYIDRLPKNLIDTIEFNRDANYTPEYSDEISFAEQDISRDAFSVLALLYLNYWCTTDEEKVQMRQMFNSNEAEHQAELREKYNPDNVFGDKQLVVEQEVSQEVQQKEVAEQAQAAEVQSAVQEDAAKAIEAIMDPFSMAPKPVPMQHDDTGITDTVEQKAVQIQQAQEPVVEQVKESVQDTVTEFVQAPEQNNIEDVIPINVGVPEQVVEPEKEISIDEMAINHDTINNIERLNINDQSNLDVMPDPIQAPLAGFEMPEQASGLGILDNSVDMLGLNVQDSNMQADNVVFTQVEQPVQESAPAQLNDIHPEVAQEQVVAPEPIVDEQPISDNIQQPAAPVNDTVAKAVSANIDFFRNEMAKSPVIPAEAQESLMPVEEKQSFFAGLIDKIKSIFKK